MSDIGLSQEQIDALLGGGASAPAASRRAWPQLDAEALADFERETMGTLPSVFNAMTGFDYYLVQHRIRASQPGGTAGLAGQRPDLRLPDQHWRVT